MQENFYRAVYAAVRRIPAGKVATYGQIALLEAEGVTFLPDGRVDMARHQWTGEDETL